MESKNPMAVSISPEKIVNGKILSYSRGCGLSWNPCFLELNGIESEGVLKQYGLDPNYGWVVWRSAFPWHTKRKPKISSLSVTIKHDLVSVFGSSFMVLNPGQCIDFTHPETNVKHTL